MAELNDTAKRMLIMTMEGKQGIQGNQRIERTNHHPVWWNRQFTITAGGDYFYEETPNTEHQAAQASAAVDELHGAGLIEIASESEDKKRQRFHITLKAVPVYNKLRSSPCYAELRAAVAGQ